MIYFSREIGYNGQNGKKRSDISEKTSHG